jgi:hypothetical protein
METPVAKRKRIFAGEWEMLSGHQPIKTISRRSHFLRQPAQLLH